jgi:hypothetical protein
MAQIVSIILISHQCAVGILFKRSRRRLPFFSQMNLPVLYLLDISSSVLKIIAMARQEAGGRRQEGRGFEPSLFFLT